MSKEAVLLAIWQALNSPVGLALIAGVYLWVIRRWATPRWRAYEGAILSAIRFAEQKIPDDTDHKGLLKLNEALRYVLRVYEATAGKPASTRTEHALREGIQIMHHRLECDGALPCERSSHTSPS